MILIHTYIFTSLPVSQFRQMILIVCWNFLSWNLNKGSFFFLNANCGCKELLGLPFDFVNISAISSLNSARGKWLSKFTALLHRSEAFTHIMSIKWKKILIYHLRCTIHRPTILDVGLVNYECNFVCIDLNSYWIRNSYLLQ
jgi:hypothetical protein